MARTIPSFCYWLVVLGLLLPTRMAAADPVTTGSLEVRGIQITGVGGVSRGDASVLVATSGYVEAALCFPCRAGETTSLSGLFVSSDNMIELHAPSFLLPDIAAGEPWTTRMPFTFSAVGAAPGEPRTEISGVGTVTVYFHTQALSDFEGTFYNFSRATYRFGEEAPIPTPEPASLLLIGTGMAGVWLRRRVRAAKPQ